MARYIDAQDLNGYALGLMSPKAQELFHKIIAEVPTKDVEPVIHGRWIEIQKGIIVTDYKCSICGRYVRGDTGYNPSMSYPYCHCGAKMDGKENRNDLP